MTSPLLKLGLLRAGKNPLDQRGEVLILQMAVRRHRDIAPDTLPTGLDLGDQPRFGIGLPLVAGDDFVVAGADDLALHAVAGHAAALGRQFQRAGVSRLLGRFRAERAGATHRAEAAVLVGQLAVRRAGVLGQGRADLHFRLAVLHAGDVFHIRHTAVAEATLLGRRARPQAVVGRHAVAGGPPGLDFGDVLVGPREVAG